MTSRRKRVRRLLRWDRWIAHYPPTIAAPPAAVRAYQAAHRLEFADEWFDAPTAYSDDGRLEAW